MKILFMAVWYVIIIAALIYCVKISRELPQKKEFVYIPFIILGLLVIIFFMMADQLGYLPDM